jgi:hypothetical protein
MQKTAALCVAHAIATSTMGARAVPPDSADAVTLRWTAPAGCPGMDEVKADIRRILGASPQTAERLVATGTVWLDSEGEWRAQLTTTMRGMEGSRTLHGTNCDEVTHAAALVLALMLKPESPPRQRTPPSPQPSPQPEPQPVPRAAAEAPADGPWFARGAVLTGAGTLPGLEAGYGMHLGLASSHWSAELRGAYWLPKTARSDTLPGAGAKFSLLELSPAVCLRVPDTWLRLDTCAGAKLNQMTGKSFGVSDPGSATARWSAAFVEQAASAALTRNTSVRLGLELVWPPSRPVFAIEHLGEIHRPARLAGRAGLAFEVTF